jgi:hypothetical protein
MAGYPANIRQFYVPGSAGYQANQIWYLAGYPVHPNILFLNH